MQLQRRNPDSCRNVIVWFLGHMIALQKSSKFVHNFLRNFTLDTYTRTGTHIRRTLPYEDITSLTEVNGWFDKYAHYRQIAMTSSHLTQTRSREIILVQQQTYNDGFDELHYTDTDEYRVHRYALCLKKASSTFSTVTLSLIHIWRCRRIERCRSRWSPYH